MSSYNKPIFQSTPAEMYNWQTLSLYHAAHEYIEMFKDKHIKYKYKKGKKVGNRDIHLHKFIKEHGKNYLDELKNIGIREVLDSFNEICMDIVEECSVQSASKAMFGYNTLLESIAETIQDTAKSIDLKENSFYVRWYNTDFTERSAYRVFLGSSFLYFLSSALRSEYLCGFDLEIKKYHNSIELVFSEPGTEFTMCLNIERYSDVIQESILMMGIGDMLDIIKDTQVKTEYKNVDELIEEPNIARQVLFDSIIKDNNMKAECLILQLNN